MRRGVDLFAKIFASSNPCILVVGEKAVVVTMMNHSTDTLIFSLFLSETSFSKSQTGAFTLLDALVVVVVA